MPNANDMTTSSKPTDPVSLARSAVAVALEFFTDGDDTDSPIGYLALSEGHLMDEARRLLNENAEALAGDEVTPEQVAAALVKLDEYKQYGRKVSAERHKRNPSAGPRVTLLTSDPIPFYRLTGAAAALARWDAQGFPADPPPVAELPADWTRPAIVTEDMGANGLVWDTLAEAVADYREAFTPPAE